MTSSWIFFDALCKKQAWLICVFLLSSCGAQKNEQQSRAPSWTIPTISESELIDRFADHMVPHASDTADLENNQVINYIIDNSLDYHPHTSGIFYHILDVGGHPLAKWGDKTSSHYAGYLLDGTCFDSSRNRGEAFTSYIGNAILGWNAAMAMLGKGGRGVFIVPAHLAYGSRGFGHMVGPHQHLRFEIELLEIHAQ